MKIFNMIIVSALVALTAATSARADNDDVFCYPKVKVKNSTGQKISFTIYQYNVANKGWSNVFNTRYTPVPKGETRAVRGALATGGFRDDPVRAKLMIERWTGDEWKYVKRVTTNKRPCRKTLFVKVNTVD